MSRFPILAILLLFLGSGPLAPAQFIGIRTLALKEGELPEVHVAVEEGHQALEFSSTQPSEALKARQADPLPLYRLATDEDGNEAFVIDRKLKLPDGAKGILILAWTAGSETQYAAIKDDFSSARFNDWLLINAGSRPVAFQAGEKSKSIAVKPGESVKYRPSVEEGKGATVAAQASFDGKTKTFYNTFWPVFPGKRTIVLFADDGKKIRVKRISDVLEKPAKP